MKLKRKKGKKLNDETQSVYDNYLVEYLYTPGIQVKDPTITFSIQTGTIKFDASLSKLIQDKTTLISEGWDVEHSNNIPKYKRRKLE
tara:strand:+ start:7142 stop:7402 length:261 start_codon:yes stop_codon:yes gene_type:complete